LRRLRRHRHADLLLLCLCTRLHYVGHVHCCHPLCGDLAAPGSVVEENPSRSCTQQFHHVLCDAYGVSGTAVLPIPDLWFPATSRVLPLTPGRLSHPTHPLVQHVFRVLYVLDLASPTFPPERAVPERRLDRRRPAPGCLPCLQDLEPHVCGLGCLRTDLWQPCPRGCTCA
jgi:hypothetical protein